VSAFDGVSHLKLLKQLCPNYAILGPSGEFTVGGGALARALSIGEEGKPASVSLERGDVLRPHEVLATPRESSLSPAESAALARLLDEFVGKVCTLAVPNIETKFRVQFIPLSAGAYLLAATPIFSGASALASSEASQKDLALHDMSFDYLLLQDSIKIAYADAERLNTSLQELSRNQRKLIERHERDLATAGSVQRALSPAPTLAEDGLEYGFVWHSLSDVGGDFIRTEKNELGQRVLLLLDVCGHDIAAGLVGMLLNTETSKFESPASLLRRLNEILCDTFGETQQVMAGAVVVDASRSEVTFCRSGLPKMLLVREGKAIDLGKSSSMLGFSRDGLFEDESVTLAPGDTFALASDGFESAVSRRFGSRASLSKLFEYSVQQDLKTLTGRFRSLIEDDGELDDDVSFAFVRRSAEDTH
jgi:serine phosphatase RsbU (regulator of sigma subunit)